MYDGLYPNNAECVMQNLYVTYWQTAPLRSFDTLAPYKLAYYYYYYELATSKKEHPEVDLEGAELAPTPILIFGRRSDAVTHGLVS